MKTNQFLTKRTVAFLLSFLLVTVCYYIPTSASTIQLNKTKATIQVGKTTKLSVKGTKKKVTWSSQKRAVATVNKKGVVTGKKVGTTFIYAKVSGKTLRCKVTVKPAPSIAMTVNDISIRLGDSVSTLKSKFGEPDRIDESVYSFDYYVYNINNYKDFFMVGIKDSKVVAFYSDTSTFKIGQLTPSYTIDQVNTLFKSSISPSETDDFIKNSDGIIYHLFFDQLGDKNLVGVLASSVSLIEKERTPAIIQAEERQIFDTCNSARVRHGLSPLTWSEQATASSKKHSTDMANNNYFSHTSLSGTTPGDRLKAEGISWRGCGENIIAGYEDGISANNGWLNSSGHRSNMLNPNFTHLGVGGATGGSYGIYFTQNFYQQR